jgi:hypothetical protein
MVAALRNILAAMSAFVSPAAASRAIRSSCGVRSRAVSTVRLRTVSPVAAKLVAGPCGESVGAHGDEGPVRVTQLLSSVRATVLPAEPLAVHQPAAREMNAGVRGLGQSDGLPIEILSRTSVGHQRA